MLAAGAAVALLSLAPLIVIAVSTINVGWTTAMQLLLRPRVGELLGNTLGLMAGSLPVCLALGVGSAWLTQRTDLPKRAVWHTLLAAPLAVPAFVNSFGWISLAPRFEGYGGAVLIVTLSYFPLVYLPVAAALNGLDPALEEAALSLSKGTWTIFFRVVLPQLRPACLGGLLLVSLHLLAEFGALQMLRFPTFTTAIYDQFTSTFNGPAANMLAAVLISLCLLLLLADMRLRERGRYARVGSGARRVPRPAHLGRFTPLAALALFGLLALALGVPVWSLTRWIIEGRSTTLVADQLLQATFSSLQLGVEGAAVSIVLALPIAWLSVRARGLTSTILERSTFIGHSLPGIVVALALVTIAIRFARPIYQTVPLLLGAYVILFLPLATVSIRAGLLQASPGLEEAAHSLGVGRLSAFVRVTLRLILPNIGTGAALVFLAIVTELTATLLISPIGTQTLATRFWAHADEIAYGAAAPYAALMVLLSLPATFFLTRSRVPQSNP
jgi:iron(III) transport system permease protein